MSSPTVLQSPHAFDFITLSELGRSPGFIESFEGGGRRIEIQDQGQLLTLGANSVVRMVKNRVVTYHFRLMTVDDFATRDRWLAALESNGKRTNPKVYTITDLAIPTLKRVIYEGEDPQKKVRPGGPWDWTLILHEWNRIAPYGGPVKPPQTATERAIADLSAQNAALQKQLDATKKGAKK
jgi:hypothetical protein